MGAVFAALLIPIFAGLGAYDRVLGRPGLPRASPTTASMPTSTSPGVASAHRPEEIHYTLVLGILVWGTMQFASYAVFGHHRPLAAIVMMGLVLVGNMAADEPRPRQLSFLIAFTAGSLFLLIQMHAFDERATWVRRRIGDPSTISSLYLRGGTVFIVAAMAGSMLLTQRAASAPLAGAWTGINDRLIELGEDLSRLAAVRRRVPPAGQALVRRDGADLQPLVQRRPCRLHGHGAEGLPGGALARGDLRHVRAHGLGPEQGPDDAVPGRGGPAAARDEPREPARRPDKRGGGPGQPGRLSGVHAARPWGPADGRSGRRHDPVREGRLVRER